MPRPWLLLFTTILLLMPVQAQAQDPRVGLKPGWNDAGEAILNLRHVAHRPRPEGFFNPSQPADFGYANADLAFSGPYMFVGGYFGIQVWDISNPTNPTLRTTNICPGGQGDVSVYQHLLFMSVEETRGRLDCSAEGVVDTVSAERFRGVRIFDISSLDHPRQVGAVQTCRGSHTHTLVTDPRDAANVYIYVSGTNQVRPGSELAGCSDRTPEEDPNTSLFRIEVIQVPVAAPHEARIVNAPRIFADNAGNIGGLWRGGDHGEGTQETSETDQCHDITVYTELGLAAGACSGNGILLDIRDPANPKRIDEVSDPNFAYWHSATFNNDGTSLLFTDEWGGGGAPRCRETDRPEWGANALFTLSGNDMQPVGYYKLPAPQTKEENCVAHNGSLIPVPGRDIMAQAWYQGGLSLFDFTDPTHPVEIAYFDRGPADGTKMILGGYWSTYWYNGFIYGSEIVRGLDVFELTPSEYLSQNEIDAARLVKFDHFNVQNQQRLVWPASVVVARAYLDQLVRGNGISTDRLSRLQTELQQAERAAVGPAKQAAFSQLTRTAAELERDAQTANAANARRLRLLATTLRDLDTTPR
jgi:hypothetical protein